MNPANYREALIETASDEAEGADILLVIWLCEYQVPHYIVKAFICSCHALKVMLIFVR